MANRTRKSNDTRADIRAVLGVLGEIETVDTPASQQEKGYYSQITVENYNRLFEGPDSVMERLERILAGRIT